MQTVRLVTANKLRQGQMKTYGRAVEVLGSLLAVDMDQWWTPDETFFELLRNKETINAMLSGSRR